MSWRIWLCCVLLATLVHGQSVLFPHGYFDSNKISAVDAFYLNMLAISTLEHGGNTEDEFHEWAQSRIPAKPKSGSLQEKVVNANKPSDSDESEEFEPLDVGGKERPLTRDGRPPAPFKNRVRREGEDDDDDGSNPFEDIATRAPPTVPPQLQRFLNRNQILGVSAARPQTSLKKHIGVPHAGEMSEKGWTHPRRRRPYIEIDWSKPQIVLLPLPPGLTRH